MSNVIHALIAWVGGASFTMGVCGEMRVEGRLRATIGELVTVLEDFIDRSASLANAAGSAWADAHDLSQECHWLNETSKDAIAVIAKVKRAPIRPPVKRER